MKKLRELLTEAEIFVAGDRVKIKGGKVGRVLSVKKTATGIKYLVILTDGSENTFGGGALRRFEGDVDEQEAYEEEPQYKGTAIWNAHGSHASKKQPDTKDLTRRPLKESEEPTPEMHEALPHDNQHIVPYDEKLHKDHSEALGSDRKHGGDVVKKLVEAHPTQESHPGHETMRSYTGSSSELNGHLYNRYSDRNQFKRRAHESESEHKHRMRHYKEENKHYEHQAMLLDKMGKDHPLAHDTVVYHGAGFNVEHAASKDPERKLHAPSFLSTSTSKDVSMGFGSGSHDDGNGNPVKHMLRIHLPKGHPSISVGEQSRHPGEHEIILARHTTLKVAEKPKVVKRWGTTVHMYDAHPVANELQNAPSGKVRKFEANIQRHSNISAGKASKDEVMSALNDSSAGKEHAAIVKHPELSKKYNKEIYDHLNKIDSDAASTFANKELENRNISSSKISKLLDAGVGAKFLRADHKNLSEKHFDKMISDSYVSHKALGHLVSKGALSDEQIDKLAKSHDMAHLAMASPKFTSKHLMDAAKALGQKGLDWNQGKQLDAMTSNQHFTKKHFDELVKHPDIAAHLINHPMFKAKHLDALVNSSSWGHREAAAQSPQLSDEHIAKLVQDNDSDVVDAVLKTHGRKIDSNMAAKILSDPNNHGGNHKLVDKLDPEGFKKVLDAHKDNEDSYYMMRKLMNHPEAANHVDAFLNHPDKDLLPYTMEKLPISGEHINKLIENHPGHYDSTLSYSNTFEKNHALFHKMVDRALENNNHAAAAQWARHLANSEDAPAIYRKIGQHYIDHGDHHDPDSSYRDHATEVAKMAHHLNSEQINTLLKTPAGPSMARYIKWSAMDSKHNPALMFDGVGDDTKNKALNSVYASQPVTEHLLKDQKPEQLAQLLGKSGVVQHMSDEQRKAAVAHVLSQNVENHDDGNGLNAAHRQREDALSRMRSVIDSPTLIKHVTNDQANGVLRQLLTHKGILSYDAERLAEGISDQFKPDKDVLDKLSSDGKESVPGDFTQHFFNHFSPEQAEHWFNHGKHNAWISSALFGKHSKTLSTPTVQKIAADPNNYPDTISAAKAELKHRENQAADRLKFKAPSNPELG